MSDQSNPVDSEPPDKVGGMRGIRFLGDISLGNLLMMLPLFGIFATALMTFYTVGTTVQRVQDSIEHEIELRSTSVINLSAKIDDMKVQQARDVTDIKGQIGELRSDVRTLVRPGNQPR